jgi:hypothetical protein
MILCHVYWGTRDEMTGSSSDDWILLAVRLQPFLITLNHNTIAILHILQSLFTVIFSQCCRFELHCTSSN